MTVCKVYVASFNRSSDGAIQPLIDKLVEKEMYVDCQIGIADIILAVGDRREVFDFVLDMFRLNKNIVHLWAGEISQGCHDEIYRHSITLMSGMQLCISPEAKQRVERLCESVDKTSNAFVVGNIFRDNIETVKCLYTDEPYDLVLYNPPTCYDEQVIRDEIKQINNLLDKKYYWVEPNGDKGSNLVMPYTNVFNLPRPMFLYMLKHCCRFISNSSCMYTEAPLFLKQNQIVRIGKRNICRESGISDLSIMDSVDKIVKCLNDYKRDMLCS